MRPVAVTGLLAGMTAVTLAPAVAHAQWSDLGLSERVVAQLRSGHGLLYACANNGLYRKPSDTADSAWVLLGFTGQRVHDVLVASPETLIVAREITGSGADTVAMWRSTDGGTSWSPFQNGFGADGDAWDRKVDAFLAVPGAPGAILAGSWGRIGKSTDGGVTWKKVTAGRYYFLAAGYSVLWGGGESGAFTPFAKRSTDGGETWMTRFFTGVDDVAYDMAFDPSDANVAFLGIGWTMYRTADNGMSWTPFPLPEPYGGGRALATRAFPPLRLYVNGTPPSGATIFKTDDGGATWTFISYPEAGSDAVYAILVHSGPAADTLFVATGSGVVRYVEHEIVGVGPPQTESRLELRADPNPFRGGTTFTFRLPRAARILLRVLDAGGRAVATLLSGERAAGPHRVFWSAGGLASGAYFCELRAGGEVATRKVFIVR